MKILPIASLMAPVLLLSGCQTYHHTYHARFHTSPGYYAHGYRYAGGRIVDGVVEHIRPAYMERDSGAGAFVGGSAGMIAGSQIGGDAAGHFAGALGGLLLGTLAGSQIERDISRRPASELHIRTHDGERYIMPVPDPHPFREGTEVTLVMRNRNVPARIYLADSPRSGPL